MTETLSAATQRNLLQTEIASVSEVLRANDLTTPAVGLGRWKVRDIAAHLGGVHRWAARIVTTRSQAGPGFKKSKLTGVELCDWFDEGASQLLTAFHENDAEADCPNFNPGSPNTVGWWLRRQLHETTVHRWDTERAFGSTTPIDVLAAADGVDEFLDVFVRTRGKQTLASRLVLQVEGDRAWTLTPAKKPGRIDVAPGAVEASTDPTTIVSGQADQMLLALWGRLAVADTDLAITGDETAAASLFATS